jgi:hypothetical protein
MEQQKKIRIWFFPFWNIYGVGSTYMNKKENNFQLIKGTNLTFSLFHSLVVEITNIYVRIMSMICWDFNCPNQRV